MLATTQTVFKARLVASWCALHPANPFASILLSTSLSFVNFIIIDWLFSDPLHRAVHINDYTIFFV